MSDSVRRYLEVQITRARQKRDGFLNVLRRAQADFGADEFDDVDEVAPGTGNLVQGVLDEVQARWAARERGEEMAKPKRPRMVLGQVVRADGTRVDVKSPTVWATLRENEQLVHALQDALVKVVAERDARKAAFGELCEHWWVRLGVRLGLVKLAAPASPARESAPTPSVVIEKGAAVGPSEAAA